MSSLRTEVRPTCHKGPPGYHHSSDTQPSSSPHICAPLDTRHWGERCPTPSPHNPTTSLQLSTWPACSEDRPADLQGRGCPIIGTHGPKSKNISRGYCRGRTASLPQNIKDKQSKSSKSPPGVLRMEVARFCFQMAPHIQDCAYVWMHPTSGLSEATLSVKF